MKKYMIVLMALVLCVCAAVPAFAAEKEPARLVDKVGLLSAQEAWELEQQLDEISQRQGIDVVVMTVESIAGTDPKPVAAGLYTTYGYRQDGIILLISMEDHDYAIQGMGGAQPMFTEAGRNYIADRVEDLLSDSDYAGAFEEFATLCDGFVTQARTGDPYDDHNLPKEPYPVLVWVGISLVVGVVVALIITGVMRSKLKSVRFQNQAMDYVRPDSMRIRDSREIYLYRNVTRVPKPKSSGGSSRSGRSSFGGGTSGKF